MTHTRVLVLVAALAALGLPSAAGAQSSALDHRWSFDFGLGWDNSLSGNINSGAIGTLDEQATVILPNSYDEVYGTGLHLRVGGGYMVDEITELRAVFTYQDLEADLTQMGDIGVSRLYGQYDPYRAWAIDGGLRRYFDVKPGLRAYTEGTIGVGFIREMGVVLSAPSISLTRRADGFYDATATFSLSGGVGLLWQASEGIGLFGQFGLRWTSGLSPVDDLGVGLESINDDSARWTMPVVIGVRARF